MEVSDSGLSSGGVPIETGYSNCPQPKNVTRSKSGATKVSPKRNNMFCCLQFAVFGSLGSSFWPPSGCCKPFGPFVTKTGIGAFCWASITFQKPYEFIGLLTIVMETLRIYRAFARHAQRPYEFIGFGNVRNYLPSMGVSAFAFWFRVLRALAVVGGLRFGLHVQRRFRLRVLVSRWSRLGVDVGGR